MSRASVAQVERGEIDVGLTELSRLARALGAPMSDLVADEDSR
jgi:transcriptional regulator with XRE-family HTH domain